MECIVQDFPFRSGPLDEPANNSSFQKQESNRLLDDSIVFDKTVQVENAADQDIEKTRTIRASVALDGFNYKMRLRKEETVIKVIDFSLDFFEKTNSLTNDERDINFELTDFQVLH